MSSVRVWCADMSSNAEARSQGRGSAVSEYIYFFTACAGTSTHVSLNTFSQHSQQFLHQSLDLRANIAAATSMPCSRTEFCSSPVLRMLHVAVLAISVRFRIQWAAANGIRWLRILPGTGRD